ncbi:type IV secretory system conjugative DNA transfer family protein [Rhodopseudomonas sp. NSM]|uniref:type IV secretory system conjugative DNA transfer family protein n=1 Tax=Rhodopseudomonas sp. NSM TaxID=3457630 RepID=UPI004036A0ED
MPPTEFVSDPCTFADRLAYSCGWYVGGGAMGVHGTARFAFRQELEAAELLSPWQPGSVPEGLLVGWWYENEYEFAPITYKGDLHQLIVGGIGGGKFTTCIAPLLLGSGLEDQAVVVVDPKGEIAKLAGPFFQRPFADGPSVYLLDPWDICDTGRTAVLTFLDQLTADNPNCTDDARAMADAMIIPSGAEDSHWENTARNFLTGLLLYLALDPAEEGKRDLVRLRELVTQPWAMPKAYVGKAKENLSTLLYSYMENDLGGGVIRRSFTSMLNREDKERSGIISILERETAWIDSPSMARTLRGTSLDLGAAARGGGKYFIVIPPDYVMTHRAWLRLCVTAFARAFKRVKASADRPLHKRWRHIIIDEFPSLGQMRMLLTEVAIARGYEVKYHLTVQDFPQLRAVYGEGWESFINNSFQRVFAVNDQFTAEYISKMLGTATVESHGRSIGESKSQGTSHGVSRGFNAKSIGGDGNPYPSNMTQGYSDSQSETTSQTWSESISEVARPLRTPDEVRRLPASEQFMIFRAMHGVQSWRPPYWEVFPSLPDFSLKEVLGTVGRAPSDAGERRRFERWRPARLLMAPKLLPPPAPEPALLPPPAPVVAAAAPAPGMSQRTKLVLLAVFLLFMGWWLWPGGPSTERPSPPPVTTAPPPAPVVKDARFTVLDSFVRKLKVQRRIDLPGSGDMRVALVQSDNQPMVVLYAPSAPRKISVVDNRDGAELSFSQQFSSARVKSYFGFTPEKDDPQAYIIDSTTFAPWGYAPDRLRVSFASGAPYEVDLRGNPDVTALWTSSYPQHRPGQIVPRLAGPCDPVAMAKVGVKCGKN